MADQVLIPFNPHLRMKETLPVIEEAAKPGMRVVFLFRYPLDRGAWMRDHYITTASLKTAMLAGKTVMEKYSWEGQRALAEEMVAPWRRALAKIGVSAVADVYTSSLSSVVEKYGAGNIALMPAQSRFSIMRFFPGLSAFFGSLKRGGFRSSVSVRPGH
ncbi:MAG TPA: hypothetical protein VIE89_04895 [Candidatus Binatia bacterium]|jgi:hypothetical protein